VPPPGLDTWAKSASRQPPPDQVILNTRQVGLSYLNKPIG
jgi:hypothetical protein